MFKIRSLFLYFFKLILKIAFELAPNIIYKKSRVAKVFL